MSFAREYLGDGVYVEIESGMIVLTTSDGTDDPTNTVFLELEVYDALVKYVERAKAVIAPASKAVSP